MAKKVTIETLVKVVEKGFKEADAKTDNLAKIMQKGFQGAEVRMDQRFGESDTRTDQKIDNLAKMMQKGFQEAETKTDQKIDNLAMMVQQGFDDIQSKMATKEELLETREILAGAIKDLEIRMSANLSFNREEVDRLKSWMEGIEARVTSLESRQSRKK